jgi:hypothetical protein
MGKENAATKPGGRHPAMWTTIPANRAAPQDRKKAALVTQGSRNSCCVSRASPLWQAAGLGASLPAKNGVRCSGICPGCGGVDRSVGVTSTGVSEWIEDISRARSFLARSRCRHQIRMPLRQTLATTEWQVSGFSAPAPPSLMAHARRRPFHWPAIPLALTRSGRAEATRPH